MSEELRIGIRPYQPSDLAFCRSAWLAGHWERGDWPQRMGSREEYNRKHGPVVEVLLAEETTAIAFNQDAPDQLLGFICCNPDNGLLHWVYVKEEFRPLKVFRRMRKAPGGIEDENLDRRGWPLALTSITKDCDAWISPDMQWEPPWCTYDPFWIIDFEKKLHERNRKEPR